MNWIHFKRKHPQEQHQSILDLSQSSLLLLIFWWGCLSVIGLSSSPFYRRGRGRSHLYGCDANRSGRSGSRRCRGRSWRHQSPVVPCTEGTPWGRPSSQGYGTSYGTARVSVEAGHRAQGYKKNSYWVSVWDPDMTENNIKHQVGRKFGAGALYSEVTVLDNMWQYHSSLPYFPHFITSAYPLTK